MAVRRDDPALALPGDLPTMPTSESLLGAHQDGGADIKGFPDRIEVDLTGQGFDGGVRESNMEGDFHENLAEYLYTGERMQLARDLIEYYEIDKSARKDWEQRVDTALVMLGIVKESDAKLPWKGAANMVHPGIAKAVVQYQSRAIEEAFPPEGPVKCATIGDVGSDGRQQAQRVQDFMNWYYTDGDKGYFHDTDQLHFKLPLIGSVFRKSYIDPTTGQPRQRHVGADDFVAPYNGTDLADMSRYCHRYTMSGNDIKRAVARGYFSDIQLDRGSAAMRLALADETPEDKGDDRTPIVHRNDDLYEILEYHADIEIPGIDSDVADFDLPYILHVERQTGDILRIERNWRQSDPKMLKRVWFTHYRYLPGLGFYGFGLLHLIGSLGEAATGAVRALLDTAARNNMSGGFKSNELKISGNVTIENGVWKDVNASAEELAKGFYTPPTVQASPALFQLLELLTLSIDQFTSATEAVTGEADTNAPVGTTLALIEQGSKVFSAIHKRTHASARHEFSLFVELVQFSEYESYPFVYKNEELIVLRTDFDDRIDVLPVSDPNIWSATQRIALAQATVQVVIGDPEVFSAKEKKIAYRRMFEALRVPDIDELMPPEPGPPQAFDPVTENMRMMLGRPVASKPYQDHASHTAVHENWLAMQIATLPEDVLETLLPQALAHLAEHKAYEYQAQVMAEMGMPLPMFDLAQGEEESEPMDPELEMALSAATAEALLEIPQEPQPGDPDAAAEEAAANMAAQGDEQRKNLAAEGDERRKEIAFQKEQKRLDLKAQLDARRQRILDQQKLAQADQAFRADQRRQEDTVDVQIGISDRTARTKDKAFERSSEVKNKAALASAKAKAAKPKPKGAKK